MEYIGVQLAYMSSSFIDYVNHSFLGIIEEALNKSRKDCNKDNKIINPKYISIFYNED